MLYNKIMNGFLFSYVIHLSVTFSYIAFCCRLFQAYSDKYMLKGDRFVNRIFCYLFRNCSSVASSSRYYLIFITKFSLFEVRKLFIQQDIRINIEMVALLVNMEYILTKEMEEIGWRIFMEKK